MPGNKIGITAQLDDQISGRLDKIRDNFNRLGKGAAAASLLGNVGAKAIAVGFQVAGNAVGAAVDFLDQAKKEFIEDDDSIARLTASLKTNTTGWDGNRDAIEAVLKSRMALGFSDEEQRDSLTRVLAATHDVTKALEIQSVAMDLARFKRISLEEASDALIKVEAGSFRVLKFLGIELKAGATQTEALAAVQKVAAGQADAYTESLGGRLTVAAVRAREAQEKLGQATAEFSADLEETKAGVIENFVVGLDTVTDTLNLQGQAFERQIELQRFWIGMLPDFLSGTKDQANALLDAEVANHAATAAIVDNARETRVLAGVTGNAATVFGTAADATGGFTTALRDVEKQSKVSKGAIDALVDSIENGMFGKAINAGNIASLKLTIRDLIDQRKEVHTGSLKWLELTGQIAENRKRLFDLHLEQAAAAGPQAAIDWLKKEKARTGDATGALQKLIDNYKILAGLQGTIKPIILPPGYRNAPKPQQRQHGGPVMAGEAYVVGEGGRSELFIPDRNGTIVPGTSNGGSAIAGGHGHDIYLDGRLVGQALDANAAVSLRLAAGSIGPNI